MYEERIAVVFLVKIYINGKGLGLQPSISNAKWNSSRADLLERNDYSLSCKTAGFFSSSCVLVLKPFLCCFGRFGLHMLGGRAKKSEGDKPRKLAFSSEKMVSNMGSVLVSVFSD